MTNNGKVCVLMGGQSAERDISLQSGQACLQALLNAGVDAYSVDLQSGSQLVSALMTNRPAYVLVMLHGPVGEDGTVQGLLEMLAIPYTGSGVLASALAMDKVRSKLVWQQLGLATPAFVTTTDPAACRHLRLPLCVKPIFEGSSVGVSRVDAWEDLPAAIQSSSQYGQVMVEEWIEGEVLTVGIIGDKILPVIQIETTTVFYDYQAKYLRDDTQYFCDWGLPDQQKRCQKLAWSAYQAVGCRHWGRVDLMHDKKGKNWLLEVNTIPGMTNHSLVPRAAAGIGMDFEAVVLEILSQAGMGVTDNAI